MTDLTLLSSGPLTSCLRSEVPQFLQDGSLYRTHMDQAIPITQPTLCMNFSRDVNDNSSCFSMLCTLRCWGVRSLPHELISFILSTELDLDEYTIIDFLLLELPSVRLLQELRDLPIGIWVEFAMEEGDLQVVKHFVEHAGLACSERSMVVAIRNNHLECLNYARTQGFPMPGNACELAASEGHMECLKYQLLCLNICVEAVRGSVLQNITFGATILEYVCQQGGAVTEAAFHEALKHGHLRSLNYLMQQHNTVCHDVYAAYKTAIKYGQLSSLQFLHENGFQWDEYVVHALCRRLVRSSVSSIRCAQYEACLRYCVPHRCPFDWTQIEHYEKTYPHTSECLKRIFEPAVRIVQYENVCKIGVVAMGVLFVLATAEKPMVCVDRPGVDYVETIFNISLSYNSLSGLRKSGCSGRLPKLLDVL